MGHFYYTIKQKLHILDLVETGQIMRLATQFPQVTQKQIEDWKEKGQEIRALSETKKATKCTLHKGPTIKYRGLY